MSIAEIQKIQILAHSGVKMDFLSSLQEEGLIHIEHSNWEEMGLSVPSPADSHLDHRLHRLSNALEYLSQWKEGRPLQRLFSPKPQLSWQKREEALDFDFDSLLNTIEDLERRTSEAHSRIKFLEKETEFLEPLAGLELPVLSVKSTDKTRLLLGSLPVGHYEDLKEFSKGEPFFFREIFQDKRTAILLLLYWKGEEESVEQQLKEWGFSSFEFTDPVISRAGEEDRVLDVMEKIKGEISAKSVQAEELKKEGQKLAVHREKLMGVYDVTLNERGKMASSRLLGETGQAFFLEGWILSSDIEKLRGKLQPYSDLIEFYTRPPLPEEEPPVVLENPKAAKPFELVTKLYGLPQRGSMDPTLALAPFFFLFVGLTVSEAGYGLLVALSSFLFLKFAKPKGGLRQFLQLLLLLGISTVILGTLVGGWFGFPVRKLMVLDPLKDPLSFLILSLVLGFVQVWFGTLLNLISGIRNRNALQAVCVQGGWLVLLPSLVLYFLLKQPVWGIAALAGASGIVLFASPSRNPIARFFGGLYSLYDISRYLADILSYSRLLALGLATSVIAMVVNTLCQTVLGIPWVGWLMAALIFVGGHLFNLGISFLGGFVHSMRLQFVEFFSKFFQAGGKPFKPFALESKYVEFI